MSTSEKAVLKFSQPARRAIKLGGILYTEPQEVFVDRVVAFFYENNVQEIEQRQAEILGRTALIADELRLHITSHQLDQS